MSRRPTDDLDRAVLLARRAVTTGHLARPEPLTRFLHQRWFLGRTPCGVPAQRRARASDHPEGPSGRHSPGAHQEDRGARVVGPWRTWNRQWEQRSVAGEDLLRVYLSCAPHTSLHVVGAVAAHAHAWTDPWLLSSRAMSQSVPAPDATVLYVPLDALATLRDRIGAMLEDIRPFLAATVPTMTLPVAYGAAVAQNPANGRPYGEQRCALIAGGVVAHRERGHRETVDRVRSAFRRAGIDPAAPYRAWGATWQWQNSRMARTS